MTDPLDTAIFKAIKPIIDEHTRIARDANCALQRDLNEARAHLQTAKDVCERLTKQAPQTQQDGPWCIVGVTLVKGAGRFTSEVPVAFESAAVGWGEDCALAFSDRAAAETVMRQWTPNVDVFSVRVVPVVEWFRIVNAYLGAVGK